MEAYHKLPQNFRRHQRKFPGNFLKTSSGPAAVSRKFPRNFLAGVLTLGLLILTLGANFAHSGKPNFYIFTLRIDFEGKAKTGEVKIFNFGFEVNFLTCLVYWVLWYTMYRIQHAPANSPFNRTLRNLCIKDSPFC